MLSASLVGVRILRPASSRINYSQGRKFSLKRLIGTIFGTTTNGPHSDNMSTLKELEEERQKLKGEIYKLVDQMERRKREDEIRLNPEQIFKSEEEMAAAAAMEKLELKESLEKAATKTSPNVPDAAAKKVQPKGAKKVAPAATKEPEKPLDVSRLDLRIGKMLEVNRHPDADALYVEKIDCGDTAGPRTVISGLVKHIPIEEMQGRLVVVLCNLKPAKMRGILSEAMVMCASTDEKVELIQPPLDAKPGDRVIFELYPGQPDDQLNPKKKIWEQIAPDLKTNNEGIAMYKDCPFKLAGSDSQFRSNLINVQIR